MGGQSGTFDTDIVECLHGIVSRLRALRSLLSVISLENFVLFKKNKIFEWVKYLKICYPKIHKLLYDLTFKKYSIKEHMLKENHRKKTINRDKLQYFCDRVGIVAEKKDPPSSQSQGNQNHNKANKANLNTNSRCRKSSQSQTKAGRRMAATKNKRNKQRRREEAIVRRVRRRRKKSKDNKKKNIKMNDLFDMVGIDRTIVKYALFIKNVKNKKPSQPDIVVAETGNDSDVDDSEDDDLIQECLVNDDSSDSDSDDDDCIDPDSDNDND